MEVVTRKYWEILKIQPQLPFVLKVDIYGGG